MWLLFLAAHEGFLQHLNANSAGYGVLVSFLTLLGATIGGIFYLREYWRNKELELLKRQLDMQREAYLELMTACAEVGTDVSRILSPPQPGEAFFKTLSLAVLKVQLLGKEETVTAVMALQASLVDNLAKILPLRAVAHIRSQDVVRAEELHQQMGAAFNQAFNAVNSFREKSDVPNFQLALKRSEAVGNQLNREFQRVQAAKQANVQAWKPFLEAIRQFLNQFSPLLPPVILCLRQELGIKTSAEEFLHANEQMKGKALRIIDSQFNLLTKTLEPLSLDPSLVRAKIDLIEE